MSALPIDVLSGPRRAPLPLLLVEDNDGDAELITDLLAEADGASRRPVLRATRLGEAVELLGRSRVAAVLLDLHLPDGIGVDCVTAVRRLARDVPIIVLTGMDDDQLALSCVAAGAQDYLSKQDVRPRALGRAIDYAMVRAREARARLRTEALRLRSEELAKENQRIQEISHRKGRYLANMSHELRTPLNAIIGFSQLMTDGAAPLEAAHVQRYATHILSSGRHLLELINDILDLARIEAGGLMLNPEPTSVPELARGVVDIVTGSFPDKPMLVDLDVDPALGAVLIDPLRLRQVLYNYLSNAWKFTPAHGRVTVRATRPAEGRWRLEVEDTGPGIAEDDQSQLFTEFTRLAADARRQYPGTGLGLALTKRIVEAQGGAVGVRSAPGQGATFFAEYPDLNGP